jgi:hypothetical protein
VLTRSHDEIVPAETVFEDEDLNHHKESCQGEDCSYTEADTPTRFQLQMGQCDDFAIEAPAAQEESTSTRDPGSCRSLSFE